VQKQAFGKGPLNFPGLGAEVNAEAIRNEFYLVIKNFVRPFFKLMIAAEEERHHTQWTNQRKIVTNWKEFLDDRYTF
jgi:hypothetical protein